MNTRRWWVAGSVVLLVAVVGCGGDDDSSDEGSVSEATSSADDQTAETGVDDTSAADSTTELPGVNILTDFGDVCRGVRLDGATDYDEAVSGVHPIVAVSGEHPEYEASLVDLPDTWDPVPGEEASVELVVCLRRIESTLSQTCDGYQDDDGADTGNTVEVYDATYEVRLLAARTTEQIASTEMKATDEECPMFVFFDEGETVKPWYAEPDDQLVSFLSYYVET